MGVLRAQGTFANGGFRTISIRSSRIRIRKAAEPKKGRNLFFQQVNSGISRIFSIILVLTIFAVFVWGCGLFPQEDLKGWVGFHREELIRVMGPPTRETSLPDGGTRLEFVQRITRHPSAAQQYGVSYICHKTFDLDAKGFITDASEEGC